jgi:cytoskeleton protein RodZ
MSEGSVNMPVDNNSGDDKTVAPAAQREFGIYLREARQAAGLTTSDVSDRLKLHVDIIKAMENSRVDVLPAAAFTQGYIKAYAKLLKISPDEIMRAYDAMVPNKLTALNFTSGVPAERSSRDGVVKVTSYLLVVLALILVAFWIQQSGFELPGNIVQQSESTEVVQPSIVEQTQPDLYPVDMLSGEPDAVNSSVTSSAPEVSVSSTSGSDKASVIATETTAPATPAVVFRTEVKPDARPVQKLVAAAKPVSIAQEKTDQKSQPGSNGDDIIRLRAAAESWGEVQDADNNRLFYSLMKAGDSYAIKGRAPFKVFLGNAPSVVVEINNQLVDISRYVRQNKIAHVKISAVATAQSGGARETTNQVIDQFVPETSGNNKTE